MSKAAFSPLFSGLVGPSAQTGHARGVKSTRKKPDRSLIVALSITAVVVMVSLIVVFSRGTPELRDPSTPEGVVQRYAAAVISGDEAVARTYLTEAAGEQCNQFENVATDNIRVTLLSTTERADSADVKVLIVTSYEGGPFGNSEDESEEVFDLVRADVTWTIVRAPYQLTVCTGR